MGFNDQIIAEFRANDGVVGGPFEGATIVLLHTIGAKSGAEHVIPLAAFPRGDVIAVVASAAGAPKHPAWYHNVIANPEIDIEIGSPTGGVTPQRVLARVVEGDERVELWQQIVETMPGFADYQTKTDRLIPVFVLDPVDQPVD